MPDRVQQFILAIGALLIIGYLIVTNRLPEPVEPVEPSIPPVSEPDPPSDDITRLLAFHNAERTKPLTIDPKLAVAAEKHAKWMSENRMSHRGENGSSPADRIEAEGYSWSRWAENVAMGDTPERAFQLWIKSPPHRRNIRNESNASRGL